MIQHETSKDKKIQKPEKLTSKVSIHFELINISVIQFHRIQHESCSHG